MRPQPSPFHPALRVAPFLLAAASFAATSSAQTATPPLIKVESHEVVLPIEVIRETKSTGVVAGPNGEAQLGRVLHSKEVTGLSPKSVHIFEDGVEQKIQHFSMEKDVGWVVRDNIGSRLDYSCTPRGVWVGPNVTNKIRPLHAQDSTCISLLMCLALLQRAAAIESPSRLTADTPQSSRPINIATQRIHSLTH